MCSIAEVLETVTAAVANLDAPDTGLGSTSGADYLALRAVIDRLDTIGLRWLASLDAAGVAAGDGSASTAAWVSRRTGSTGAAAAAEVRLARRLHTDPDRRLATTAQLLDAGKLTVGHARAIARATATITPDVLAMIEPAVAEAATRLGAGPAGDVAAHVARHAEALHADQQDDPVAARRAAADAGRRLHLSQVGDMWALDALLTPEAGQALKAVLDPLSVPCKGDDGTRDERTAAQRRADAIGEAATTLLATDRLPVYGGHRPQVTVHVDLGTLLTRRGEGWYDDGTPAPADVIERIGCDARVGWIATYTPDADTSDAASQLVRQALTRISPALGGLPTQILDTGRTERFATPAQRAALNTRDRGCAFPGCDRPPDWCQAHHLTHWTHGGPTDLDNMILICEHHHQAVHRGWQLTRAPDGTITATPPGATTTPERLAA